MKVRSRQSLATAAISRGPGHSCGLLASAAMGTAAAIWWSSRPSLAITTLSTAAALAATSFAALRLLRPINANAKELASMTSRIVAPAATLVLSLAATLASRLAPPTPHRQQPLHNRPTNREEGYWIVPEISFGPCDTPRQH